VHFPAFRGKNQGGGRAPDAELLHQVHVLAAFQAHRDEAGIQGLSHLRVGVGLPDQPRAVGSAFQMQLQNQGQIVLPGFFLGFLKVAAPINYRGHRASI